MDWLFFLSDIANDRAMLLSFVSLLIVVFSAAIVCIRFVIIPAFCWVFRIKKSNPGMEQPVKTALKKAAEKAALVPEEEIDDSEADRSEIVLVGLGLQEIKVEFSREKEGDEWNAYIIVGDHKAKVRGIKGTDSLKESMLKTLLHLEVKQV